MLVLLTLKKKPDPDPNPNPIFKKINPNLNFRGNRIRVRDLLKKPDSNPIKLPNSDPQPCFVNHYECLPETIQIPNIFVLLHYILYKKITA